MHSGNAFVVVLCALAMVMEVELRSNIAAAVQSSYGSGFASSGAGVQSGGAGLSSGSGLSRSGSTAGAAGYRAPANGGSQSNGYYSRGSGYTSYNHGGYSPSSGQNDEKLQKETKYYYGGKYQGSCVADGLYYRDDTTFVICSNGYPHEQPCPPGTKTSGSPRYQAGYYYGYTDLCSVNLVDYGYGPEYYAPRGYPEEAGSGPGRELQDNYGSGHGSSRGAGGSGHGSTGYGAQSSTRNSGSATGGSHSAGGLAPYDRVSSFGVREPDYGLRTGLGLYGSGASSASVNKNRQYDITGNGYGPSKADSVQFSGGYSRDLSNAGRPASYGFGGSKSSSGYQASSAADASFAPKSRDSSFSLSKSSYLGGSSDNKYI